MGDDNGPDLAFAHDTRRALADAGLNDHQVDCVEAYYAGRHSVGVGRDPREFLRIAAQPGEVPGGYLTTSSELAALLRSTRAVRAEREAELLELKGPCSDADCRLHCAHRGPHDVRPAAPEHATVDGVVLRDQTAGELGLTTGRSRCVVVCLECGGGDLLPIPFEDEAVAEQWAEVHCGANRHTVRVLDGWPSLREIAERLASSPAGER